MSESYHIEDEVQERSYDHLLMARLLALLSPYKAFLLISLVLLIIGALLSNLIPLTIMVSFDQYIPPSEGSSARQVPEVLRALYRDAEELSAREGLSRMIMFLVCLVIAEGILRYTQILIVSYVGQRAMLEMRVALFAHIQRMSLRFVDKNPIGRLISRVTSDVEKIQQSMVSGMVQVISDLLTIIVVIGFMFAINWELALIALSPVPLVFITSLVFRRYAHRAFLEIQKRIARVSANLQENVTGIRIVQLFSQEESRLRKFRTLNADHRDEWLRQVGYFAVYFPVVEFLGTISIVLLIYYTARHQIVSGVDTLGMFFAFMLLSERLFEPVRALADRYNIILEAMASSERIFQLLDSPEEVKDIENPHTAHTPDLTEASGVPNATPMRGEVEFRDVSFAYEDEQWVLKNLSVKINAGEHVAIVGHTGAGKSTIINLLSRLYDIQSGEILIDGIDVRNYEQISLRRNIGIVLQDVFLFSGTIEDNIRLGDPSMTEADIHECAKLVNASSFIDKLPGNYQYDVGERGCNLSTGQRQLLALARMIAHKPRVLVLDEATSSIDTETEMLIQDVIQRILDDDGEGGDTRRTNIVVAHRLSTIQHADRILVMHHGELRESGTHEELIAQSGIYRTLYELQFKGQQA
jgi:ATP-binding cassette subfamily B protein